jgi:hypothetical protein
LISHRLLLPKSATGELPASFKVWTSQIPHLLAAHEIGARDEAALVGGLVLGSLRAKQLD